MQIPLIDDDGNAYVQAMRSQVLPALEQCGIEGWMEPAAAAGLAQPPTSGRLHYMVYDAQRFNELNVPGASAQFRGAVVIAHGFTEFAEKYSEMIWYFLLAGFSVCVMEHRGHGYSPRDVSNPSLVWIDDWHRYVADFAQFARTVGSEAAQGSPLYLYAHSLGGAIGTAVMEQHPDLFDKAVLSAPSMSPNCGLPNWLAFPFTGAATKLGLGKRHAPGQHDYSPSAPDKGHDASAPARARWYMGLRRNNEHYQTKAASLGYTFELLKIGRAVQREEYCANIEAPILLCQAGRDAWVHEDGQFRFVERVQGGGGQIDLVRFDTAEHEIYSMPNEVLREYIDNIMDFLIPDID